MPGRDISSLYRVVRGEGPGMILVHGSATDADGWTTQLATLSRHFRLLAYDRRGTERSALPDADADRWPVGEHAEDIVALARAELGPGPVLAVGSSFGAVCLLEAARRHPEVFAGVVLIEPPLPETDTAPPVSESFMLELERLAEVDPRASARFFLRTVLGRKAFEAMPDRWKERSLDLHQQILFDSRALAEYAPRYADLHALEVPFLLVGGGRSAAPFKVVLRALARSLPRARVEIIEPAGHMLHAEAARSFAALVIEFASEVARR